MRRPLVVPLLMLAVLALVGGCSDDDAPAATSEPETTSTSTTGAAVPAEDPALAALLVDEDGLPAGFVDSGAVDDTITAFCAGEDAAAGLQASARAARGFTREGGGASVIQLAFRFRDDDAAAFVDQATAILERCSGVPDVTGLAFDYEPLSPAVEAPIAAAADAHVGRYGVNVGSGSLTIDVVVFRHGDVGQLAAVFGVDTSRAELDELAAHAFAAMAAAL